MKTILALFAFLFIIVLAIIIYQNYTKSGILPFSKPATATINSQTFNLIAAKSAKDKEIGLSNKNSLPQNTGMIFIFDKADFYSFWMRNMKFPIDILFINGNKIVTIFQNAQPQKNEVSIPIYKSKEPADKVLEINAGLSQKYNIKEGDIIKIENL